MDSTILLIDDEPVLLRAAKMVLEGTGRSEVVTLTDSREVLPLLESQPADVIVTDLGMPLLSGQELLQELVARQPDIPVIVMTGTNDLDTAVQCMRMGAVDYLLKPVDPARLVSAVNRALELRGLRTDLLQLKKTMLEAPAGAHAAFAEIVTNNREMLAVFRFLEAVKTSSQPVLITGQSGTGKALLARAIHRLAKRAGAFVPVNVAGMDDAAFTTTLFGRAGGGFGTSGMGGAREGLVAGAGAGTLFLEEISELAMLSQVKLLHLLQDGTYYPMDSDQPRHSQARLVVAARGDLRTEVAAGRFRRDLYSRLQRQHVELPALRGRLSDLTLLVPHFLEQAAANLGRAAPKVPPALYQLLRTYHFPGNISELEAMCFDVMARHRGNVLALQGFKEIIDSSRQEPTLVERSGGKAPGSWFPEQLPTLQQAEDALIDEAMRRAGNNQGVAASLIGEKRATLNAKLIRRKKKRARQAERT